MPATGCSALNDLNAAAKAALIALAGMPGCRLRQANKFQFEQKLPPCGLIVAAESLLTGRIRASCSHILWGSGMKITRIIALAIIAGTTGAAGIQAQTLRETSPPSEFPPASYKGKQYVDSRGCIYIRAGIDGNVTWVPRVSRSRKQICGYAPTKLAGATRQQPAAPAPELITLEPGQQPAQPAAAAPAAAKRPSTAAKPAAAAPRIVTTAKPRRTPQSTSA